MKGARAGCALLACIGAALLFASAPGAAADAGGSGATGTAGASGAADAKSAAPSRSWGYESSYGLKARGYINARYAYIGLSHAPNKLSGLQITGSFEACALSDRIVLKYRSHSWIELEHTPKSVLESPFRSRHVVQSISIEADRLAAGALDIKLGRFFPEIQYGSSPVIDGGAFTVRRSRFTLDGSAGRAVDLWNGSHQSSELAAAGQLRYRGDRVGASAGYQRSSAFEFKQSEIPAGVNVTLKKSVWLDAYAGYDFEEKRASRAGLSVSWRRDAGSFSLSATRWRSPFDQLYLLAKSRSAPFFGLSSKNVPSNFDDLRLSASYGRSSWSVRGSGGSMSGVRTGWTANAYVTTPSFLWVRCEVGAQGMRTDFVEFYSYDALVMSQLGSLSIQVQSQTRSYRWLPQPTGKRTTDNYTELSLDYPLVKHIYASAAAGVFFRKFGNESFQPQAELRMIAKL
jgi:hypothetical protein